MIPLEYCLQKAAPAGSSTYYALRQARSTQRPALAALYAYRRELSETVLESSDPGVARTKLAWWHGETTQAGAGNPSHPVTRALLEYVPDLAAYIPRLLDIASGYEADLMQSRYLDFPGVRRYLETVTGRFTALVVDIANVTHAGRSNAPPSVHSRGAALDSGPARGVDAASGARSEGRPGVELGVGLGLASIIADIGEDARHGRIYLPISEMQQFGVTAADILNRRYSDAYVALMQFQAARARTQLRDALATLPAADKRRQTTLRAQTAMALRLLDEIEGEAFQVLHQRIALTPIRNLFVSWRAVHWS